MPHCVFCGKYESMIEEVEAENLDDAPDVDFPHQDAAPGHVHPHPSPDTDDNPVLSKTRRVTVEEVEDEDGMSFTNNGQYFEPRTDAGWALHEGETSFEKYRTYQEEEGDDPWSPFEDKEEWDLAHWLVKNLGQMRTEEFLKLPIHMNKLPRGPGWSCKKVTVRGNLEDEKGEMLQEEVELWSQDPVECVKELIGNPAFKEHMAYSPAKAYADHAGQHRVIDEMWTADWWGEKQLANLTVSPPMHAPWLDTASSTIAWLYCSNLSSVLETTVSKCVCRRFPGAVFAANKRGDALNSAMRDPESTKEILHKRKIGQHPPEFEANGLRAVYKPFWADLPHVDIFLAFTPDLLHQLHKGVFKDHLVKWCIDIIGEDEMDARFKAIPNYPGLQHFKKGISSVKQWTGHEHKEMHRVLVVARSILDFSYYAQLHIQTTESLEALQTALTVFHANKDILKELAVREHFNIPKLHQLSHYVQSITLFGAADGFNTELPERLHIDFAKDSYRASNKRDYEEQMALWLQRQEAVFIRSAYLDWLSQQPHSNPHDVDADSDTDSESETPNLPAAEPLQATHVLAKVPTHPHQSVQTIITAHGATEFLPALQSFLLKNLPHNTIVPGLQDRFDLYCQVVIVTPPDLRVSDVPKQRRIRATPEKLPSGRKPGTPAQFDMALIADRPRSSHLHTLEGIFFAEFLSGHFDNSLVSGVRVAQVRAIFTLPHQFGAYSRALAYVEWFTPFKPPDPSSRMRQVSCSTRQLRRNAAVVHVDEIVRPCHLIPRMGQSVDLRLRSGNAYEVANDFYFNEFIDGEMFCACVIK
ncbi:hypothetical protein EV702DRAFT_1046387 [Suillus placidus]|uniref:Uncharacterized protein n=1 Tax=Suillus placidus TaxID=48579 RepID=A0A9P6ZT31_9AGAM|nr:hypothetical protein EV702DRAFT_1046387 [Suillus placidus]